MSTLTKEEAALRSKCLDNKYIFNQAYLQILNGDGYKASITLKFYLKELHPKLFLDWEGKSLLSYQINRNNIENPQSQVKDNKIYMDQNLLKVGENEITCHISNNYSNDGNGLHKFIDTDKLAYIYSHCEPFSYHRIMPSFDQPDLKGTFSLVALAHKDNDVISNEQLLTKEPFAESSMYEFQKDFYDKEKLKEYNVFQYKETKPLSTYLYAICCGPYKKIACNMGYHVPMNLYCRSSLLQHLQKDANEIFELAIEGMKFYEKLFGFKYPFSKYDQVFCPEYNMGAMENAGCVTVNDVYIFKEPVTVERRAYRAITITHELSHMWFGDLVTMKWWNDLWLNESFAEFISHVCNSSITLKHYGDKLSNVWILFFVTKCWGYSEDQMRTTHPITGNINNTDEAENIFDGITYAKGAAVLKQVYFMMGQSKFSKAMTSYFNKFAYKNAVLRDFIDNLQQTLQDEAGFNMIEFEHDWLNKAGVNELIVSTEENKIVSIDQCCTLPEHDTLRQHILKLVSFDENGKELEIKQITIGKEKDKPTQIEMSKPFSAILLNYNDEGFVKVRIDKQSKQFFIKSLKNIENPLSRSLIWKSLWDSVRDGQNSYKEFLQAALNNIEFETHSGVLRMLLDWLSVGLEVYTPHKFRKELRAQLFQLIHKLLTTKKWENHIVILLKQKLLAYTFEEEHIQLVYDWYCGKEMKEIELGLQNKWSIVELVNSSSKMSAETKQKILKEMCELDKSDTSQDYILICKGLNQPKEQTWNFLLNKAETDKLSVQRAEQVMEGFNHKKHYDEVVQFKDKFFDSVLEIFETRSKEFGKAFFSSLFPQCDDLEDSISKSKAILEKAKSDILIKQLKEEIDILERRVKTYKVF